LLLRAIVKPLARLSCTLVVAALGCNGLPTDVQNASDPVTAAGGAPAAGAAGGAPGATGAPGAPGAPDANTLALAADLPAQCSGSEIVRIDRPASMNDPSMGHFSYGYRFKAPTTAGAPVMVFLPGGPGMPSTNEIPEFLPDGWGYLLTDPRGVGCNTLAAVPGPAVSGAFFRTEEFAGDAIAAIQDRHLENYVLYGVSYGTQLGMWVAHGLEAKGVTAPRAVVLEGVLGRAFRPEESIEQRFIDQWERLRPTLPKDVLEELDTKDAPYGLTVADWNQALPMALMGGPAILGPVLSLLSTDNPVDATRDGALDELRQLSKPFDHSPGTVELYTQVACREIFPGVPDAILDLHFVHGRLVREHAGESAKCSDRLTLSDPYDSAKLQFSTKLYAFIGEDDPDCDVSQGNYLFDQHQGHGVRVLVKRGGHGPLQANHAACASEILESIADGGSDLEMTLSLCPTNVHAVVDEK
jgi:pimeloyl-ACP methyl ester carboxylesterase